MNNFDLIGARRFEFLFISSYDPIGQLTGASGKESGGASRLHEQLIYGYDAAHNLNWRTNNALIQTFGVNSLNELTTSAPFGTLTVAGSTTSAATNVTVNGSEADLYADRAFAKSGFMIAIGSNSFTAVAKDSYGRQDTDTVAVTVPATNTFAYDGNGNLRTNGTRIFEHDDENRLIAMTEPSAWKSEFVYDGAHRRRIQRDYAWTGTWALTNETRLIYDGNRPVQHRDGANNPVLTFTRGLDLSTSLEGAGGIGGLLAMTEHSPINPQLSTGLYHCDGNGNVTCLVGTNQLVLARYHYHPFGQTLSISGPKAGLNPYRFSSKPVHELSGTYDYLRRCYDPSLQRWLNRDPIVEVGGLNLYGFVLNGPVNAIDPTGEFTASFGRAWIREIQAGRNALWSQGTGWGAVTWNTVIGSAASLGEGIPDLLLFGDALGDVSADPCAKWYNWLGAGFHDTLRGVGLVSVISGTVTKTASAVESAIARRAAAAASTEAHNAAQFAHYKEALKAAKMCRPRLLPAKPRWQSKALPSLVLAARRYSVMHR